MKREEREQKKLLVLGMHANNSSNAEICKALDVSDSFVLAVLKEKGLKSNRKTNTKITNDLKAKVIELVSSGMSYSKAARTLGTSETTAGNIWREYCATTLPANASGSGSGSGSGNEPSGQPSPIQQIIKGLEMVLEGFERLE